MVTPYLPYPPASGGQIRTLNLLKYLGEKNDITLVCLYKKKSDTQYSSYLKKYCKKIYLCKRAEKPWQIKNILKSVFSLKPFLIVRNLSEEASTIITELLATEQFDVIHSETFYVMPHIPETKVPILLVDQTIEFEVYKHFVKTLPFIVQPFFYFDILKLNFRERFYWKKATMVATVSRRDKEVIENIEPTIHPVVIPNGAGDEMFVETLPKKSLTKPLLLFIGNFSWLQNVEAVDFLTREIYPLLLKEMKDFTLIIAGQHADRLNIKESSHLKVLPIDPDDGDQILKLYHDSTLFVSPIHGPGGTRLKILAAMASGLPVVGTPTSFEGLHVSEGSHVLNATSKEEFVSQIKRVLSDESLYRQLQKNSFNTARDEYSWKSISAKLESVYESLKKA